MAGHRIPSINHERPIAAIAPGSKDHLSAHIIDGKALARRIKAQTAEEIRELTSDGRPIHLHAILAGDSSAGEIYARSQRRNCQDVGIEYELHTLGEAATQDDIRAKLVQLNADPSVTGVILNLPLPDGIDTPAMQYCIDPYKDVEGVNPANIGMLFYDQPIIAPCTALAVLEVLKEAQCNVYGLEAVVVGQSVIAGKPISLFLAGEMATVTGCHIATRDLLAHTRQADVLVVAVGKPNLIRAEHVKPGAVVIDVGINSVVDAQGNKKVVGDVAFEEVALIASAITPVPGGVGPVTAALLLRNTAEAARKQRLRSE